MFFFFNDTATTEIYPLSLHDALPIFAGVDRDGTARTVGHALVRGQAAGVPGLPPEQDLAALGVPGGDPSPEVGPVLEVGDRKSTRLNSSHANISHAVFCLKKKILVLQ